MKQTLYEKQLCACRAHQLRRVLCPVEPRTFHQISTPHLPAFSSLDLIHEIELFQFCGP